VAPSLVSEKADERVKTERRDAVMRAKLHRAGDLTAVLVPDADHESLRDLDRARASSRDCLSCWPHHDEKPRQTCMPSAPKRPRPNPASCAERKPL